MHTTLISAEALAAHIDDPQWIVVDCRHDLMNTEAGAQGYALGHLPNAVFAHLDTLLSGAKTGADGSFRGRHPLPARADLVAALRGLGIGDASQVVAYDAHGCMFAARLWWLLRWLGHAQVAVLDGGMAAWLAAGQALTAAVPVKPAGDLSERAALVTTIDADAVLANIESGARVLLDARAPDRFRGENETIDPVGGHIPGAKNRFFKDNLEDNGRFKSPARLKEELSALVATPSAAIMQCGSGVTACHNLLALEVAGLPGAALYPGSWSEWCADPGRPVATGAA